MIDLGHFALILAWLLSTYGVVLGFYGAAKKRQTICQSAGYAIVLCAVFSVLSLLMLASEFVNHNYRNLYVWQHSNNEMPWYYLISAIWGGMDGSMLLWATIMTIFAATVVLRSREVNQRLLNWTLPVLSGASSFFLFVVTFLTNPFRQIPNPTPMLDGNGLNPLLQNPSMMIHPPMLYLGFTGFVVPFAFCFGALLSGVISNQWIQVTRRATMVAWVFLTTGIILGGNWAYIELGWGGFWAWDPVENASFLPWLTGTAFLHSVMVQEQKGMLKIWNVVLAILTYSLTVFGTFLTRSGVVQSVHAFAETDVGWVFLAYLGVIAAIGIGLLIYRRTELKPEQALESYFSREAAFLFNNLMFLAITFTVFWGTMFPVLSEAVTGEKAVVGPPFFDKVTAPFFLALLFLMGVGPLISWRSASLKNALKLFRVPFAAGSLVMFLCIWLDPSRFLPALSFGLSVFVLFTVEAEFRRAARVRRDFGTKGMARSVVQAVKRKPRRFGGFLIHAGVAIVAIAITAASVYKIERDITLVQGGRVEVGRYALVLDALSQESKPNYSALVGKISIFDRLSGQLLGSLAPERRSYTVKQEVTTEVDIRSTLREDLYLALAGLDVKPVSGGAPPGTIDLKTTPALFKVFINPLQVWLWFGSLVMLFGSAIVLLDGVLFRVEVPLPSLATASRESV